MIPIWNDLWFPLILAPGEQTRPSRSGAQQFLGQFVSDWNAVLAALTLAIVPMLVLYMLFSRQLIRGLTSGAIESDVGQQGGSPTMRVGIVGVGSMGQTHAAGWSKTAADLAGFIADKPATAAPLAARYGAVAFVNLEELLAAVDVVDVCAPTHLHHEIVLRAAAAGKACCLREAAGPHAAPGARVDRRLQRRRGQAGRRPRRALLPGVRAGAAEGRRRGDRPPGRHPPAPRHLPAAQGGRQLVPRPGQIRRADARPDDPRLRLCPLGGRGGRDGLRPQRQNRTAGRAGRSWAGDPDPPWRGVIARRRLVGLSAAAVSHPTGDRRGQRLAALRFGGDGRV